MPRGWFSGPALALSATLLAAPTAAGETREYWFKAEEILWDFAPSYPMNMMTGAEFTTEERVFLDHGPERIGHIYRMAVYRQYTPDFGAIVDGPNEAGKPPIRKPGTAEEHLGILGPIVRAEVGDTIIVHFRNETRFPVSLHPHGVLYKKDSEGAPYVDGTAGQDKGDDAVPPQGSHTYRWEVPKRAGPAANDPTSIAWPYHSHVSEPGDVNAGLVGAIIVYADGSLDPNTGRAAGIDREFVTLFAVFDENGSSLIEANLKEFVTKEIDEDDEEEFEESNMMHGINGLLYANLSGLDMREGDKTRWYVIAMGNEVDIHTPHWHGVTLEQNGNRVDVTDVFPATAKILDMAADNPGTWMFHCHVNDHLDAGMEAHFTIEARN